MRKYLITVGILMATFRPAAAQNDERRDAVLKYWEQAMSQVGSLEAKCERVTEDKVFKTRDVYQGTAKFLKAKDASDTSRASLHLVKIDNKNVYEQLILSGAFLYEVAPGAKEIRVHELPKPAPGQNGDHNLVGLLFGMKAAQATARYKIDLVKEDQHYFYLQVESKTPQDRAEFDKAQLALVRTTYMPRQLHFLQANGNKVTWDLPQIQTPANHLRATDFDAPNLPGFKMTRVPTAGAGPNKVRSTGN